MNRAEHTERLERLINDDWPQQSILVHNRVADIRYLIELLGPNFAPMRKHAVEIETISGTALGFGDEFLQLDEQNLLQQHVNDLRAIFVDISG
jgi:hypothetical protein